MAQFDEFDGDFFHVEDECSSSKKTRKAVQKLINFVSTHHPEADQGESHEDYYDENQYDDEEEEEEDENYEEDDSLEYAQDRPVVSSKQKKKPTKPRDSSKQNFGNGRERKAHPAKKSVTSVPASEPAGSVSLASTKPTKVQEDEEPKKKQRMRSAEEVLNRLRWDPDLEGDAWVVGYEDRFLGILEERFRIFCRLEDVPLHRIRYFKFREQIVWHRHKKIDNVFGSTKNSQKIADVLLAEREAECPESDEAPSSSSSSSSASSSSSSSASPAPALKPAPVAPQPANNADSKDSKYPVSDSKDNNANRQRRESGESKEGRERRPRREHNNRKPTTFRPNHFLSLKITNSEIIQGIHEMQEQLRRYSPHYHSSLIDIRTLHITAGVFYCADASQVQLAASVLKQAEPMIHQLMESQPLQLTFDGVGHFGDKVVFVHVKEDEHKERLDRLVAFLTTQLKAAGIVFPDGDRSYQPHLTVMKLSKAARKRKAGPPRKHGNTHSNSENQVDNEEEDISVSLESVEPDAKEDLSNEADEEKDVVIKKIERAAYETFCQRHFGRQIFSRIELSAMAGPKHVDGYYFRKGLVSLVPTSHLSSPQFSSPRLSPSHLSPRVSPSRLSPSRASPSRLSPSRSSPSRLSPSRSSPSRSSPSRSYSSRSS